MYDLKVLLAGFGGQGVLFAGKVIAQAGMIEQREVSWLPSYGPEMRGGTANCSVRLCDILIGSPLVLNPNVLICMNQPSFEKFADSVLPGGLIIVDTTLVPMTREIEGVKLVKVDAQALAESEELFGLGNIVLIGKMLAETNFCDRETINKAIEMIVPASRAALVGMNKKALQLGMDA